MLLSEDNVKDFRQQGFIILKDFFDKKIIAQILDEVKEIFGIQVDRVLGVPVTESTKLNEEGFSELLFELYRKDFTTFSNCSKQIQHLISLHQLGLDKKLIQALKDLGLTKPILSVRPSILMNNRSLDKGGEKGKYWRLPPHQDWYYSQGSLDSVTAWYPFVFCNKALGSLELIPGSHLWGLQKCGENNDYGEMTEDISGDKFVTFDTQPGDLLIFVSLVVHRSGVNSTNRIRWSSQFRFNNLYERTFIERKFPNPFVYHPTRVLETPLFPQPDDLKKIFE